jgi:Mg2+ and Co2+ transporter CorA
MVIDTFGVRLASSAAEMRGQIREGSFFWLDLFGGDEQARSELLRMLGLQDPDIAWALRFGQSGGMYIGQGKLRAVTWIAHPSGDLSEVHVFSVRHCVVTVWHGQAPALDEIRQQFGERAEGLGHSHYAAVAILLQLLISTLGHAMLSLDLALDALRERLDTDPHTSESGLVPRSLHWLQSMMAGFNRYSSAVRSAVAGVEAVAGMDATGAAELNEYAAQVQDVATQLYERRRWMSDIMHDNATAIAQRQGEQINRLTLVSLIFLPVTALSGFFGMNFNWMSKHLEGVEEFLVLGLGLPALSVIASILWFRQSGLIQFNLGGRAPWRRQPKSDDAKRRHADHPGSSVHATASGPAPQPPVPAQKPGQASA